VDPDKYYTVVQTLVSIMKARGPHDSRLRTIILDHCRRGGAEFMVQAVVEYLIAHGVSRGLKGGVLLARRHVESEVFVGRMLAKWKALEPPPIAGTEDLPTYEKVHERVARAAVAAQALKALLDKKYVHPDCANYDTERDYLVQTEHVEGFCMAAVKIMEEAYRAPDEWVAEKLRDPCTTE
jgi:hypothetical protein